MIHTVTGGDICNTEADALVCTVNCVGVMGKGVALAVKLAFPDVYEPYRRWCAEGNLRPGQVLPLFRAAGLRPSAVFAFATKNHWRDPSQLQWISWGLAALAANITAFRHVVPSVAIPPLGCGAGGLDWKVVRPMIVAAFESLPVDVYLYEPEGST